MSELTSMGGSGAEVTSGVADTKPGLTGAPASGVPTSEVPLTPIGLAAVQKGEEKPVEVKPVMMTEVEKAKQPTVSQVMTPKGISAMRGE